jgi:hypothetical protein
MTNGHGAPQMVKDFSKADLVRLRDEDQQSWAKVAEALNLGSPGSARRIYSQLVRPHTESVLAGTTTRGGVKVTPVHLAEANLTAVRKAIVGKVIIVQRQGGRTEDMPVAKVVSLSKGTVSFNDGSKARSVKAAAIIATK